jgi:hypothetical protein
MSAFIIPLLKGIIMPEDDIEQLKKKAKYSKYAAIIMLILGVPFRGLLGDLLIVGGLIVALYWYFTQEKIDNQKER